MANIGSSGIYFVLGVPMFIGWLVDWALCGTPVSLKGKEKAKARPAEDSMTLWAYTIALSQPMWIGMEMIALIMDIFVPLVSACGCASHAKNRLRRFGRLAELVLLLAITSLQLSPLLLSPTHMHLHCRSLRERNALR